MYYVSCDDNKNKKMIGNNSIYVINVLLYAISVNIALLRFLLKTAFISNNYNMSRN